MIKGIIYRHVNLINGKGYTGKTERTLEKRDKDRFRPSAVNDSKSLKAAIVKYGKENFRLDVIQEGITCPEVLRLREIYWIAYFDDFHNGYNQTEGGEILPDNRGEKHPFFGKKRPDHSKWMSENMSGENCPMFGRTGEKNPMFGRTGEKSPHFGKKRSQESKDKLSRQRKGEKNPAARPEYTQARCFFFLEIAPMKASQKEKLKQFRQEFDHVPKTTIYRWFDRWQAE